MPHESNHNPFISDRLVSTNYDALNPQDTIYTVPIHLYAYQKSGGDLHTTGDGAEVKTYLDLRFVYGKYNPSQDVYEDVLQFTSDYSTNQINDSNKITFGVQIGGAITDLGANQGSPKVRDIQIPTATDIMTYYGYAPNEILGYELIKCEIRDVYCVGNWSEARVKFIIGENTDNGIYYPDNGEGGTIDIPGYSKEHYHINDNPNGYISKGDLPISDGQHISTMGTRYDESSPYNDNFLRNIPDSYILSQPLTSQQEENPTLLATTLTNTNIESPVSLNAIGALNPFGTDVTGNNYYGDTFILIANNNYDSSWSDGSNYKIFDVWMSYNQVVEGSGGAVGFSAYFEPTSYFWPHGTPGMEPGMFLKIGNEISEITVVEYQNHNFNRVRFNRGVLGTTAVPHYAGEPVEILTAEYANIAADLTPPPVPQTEVQENISANFGIPGVSIEQTLKDVIDAYSGIDLESTNGMTINNNEQLYFDESNQDKRISLGMFFFNEDNTNSLNFPIQFSDEKFNQITNNNLINNGDCKRIDKIFTDIGNNNTIAVKPEGGWEFLNLQGITTKIYNFSDDSNQNYIDSIENTDENYNRRTELAKNFIQSGEFEGNTLQGQFGYGGYYPYARLSKLVQKYHDRIGGSQLVDIFFSRQRKPGGMNTNDYGEKAPEIAEWIDFSTADSDEAFSNKKCLVLSGLCPFTDDDVLINYFNFFRSFDFANSDSRLPYILEGGDYENGEAIHIKDNNYRVLNQTQKIYDATDESLLPYTSLKIRFKMKTTVKNLNDTFPPVEVGILNRDIHDNSSYPANDLNPTPDFCEQKGGFNSYTYPNTSFNNQQSYDFGGMHRFTNTTTNVWQDFELDFKLTDFHVFNGRVKSLNFVVQSGGPQFSGQVMLDNFEVYESYDFYPDCDVRKKISIGNYGLADLTKYYDKDLEPEKYKDTTAPLEAQFYFYPRYPSNEIFGVDRTVMYEPFKKGLFYLYDVDWGDGSPKEFTSEPEQLDEEKAIYHTYEESGIYEITGFMLRLKTDKNGNPIGLINNKQFKLRININEGLDEDFSFLASEGFSFIPYKNTTPIIGGYSEQSIYYKTIKRMLGFLDDGSQTNIKYKNIDTRLKLEKALLKMDESFRVNLDSSVEGGIVPYFNTYNNVLITEGDLSVIREKDIFYINNLNLISQYMDVEVNGIDFVISPYGGSSTQGDWWRLKLTPAGAQYFEEITETHFIGQGWVSDINPNFPYQQIQIIDSNYRIETNIGYSATPPGVYPVNRFADDYTSTRGVLKNFDGTNYYINIAPVNLNYSGQYPDIAVTEDDFSSTPQVFFSTYLSSAINDDVFNDGTNIHSIDRSDFENEMTAEEQRDYMERLSTLPFPRYFQEFDFFNNDGSDINQLYNNIERWEKLGRFDVVYYLEAVQVVYPLMADFGGYTPAEINQETITYAYEEYGAATGNYGGVEWLSNAANNQLPPDNLLEINQTTIFNGVDNLSAELGKSLNDVDLTSVKYYNQPKSIWELFGFQDTEFDEIGSPENPRYWKNIIPKNYSIFTREGLGANEKPEYLATLPFPQYLEEFDIDGDGEASPVDASRWIRADIGAFRPDIANLITALRVGNNPPTEYIYPDYVYEWADEESILSGNGLEQPIENFYNTRSTIDTYSEQDWIQGLLPQLPYYPVLPKYGADGKFIDGDFPNNKILFPTQGSITDDNESNKNLLINITSEQVENNVLSDVSGNENLGFVISDYKPKFNLQTLKPQKRKTFQTTQKSKLDGAF